MTEATATTRPATGLAHPITPSDIIPSGSVSAPDPMRLAGTYRGDRPIVDEPHARIERHDHGPLATHNAPVRLPAPRGPVSAALLDLLLGDPTHDADLSELSWSGDVARATTDDDLQLALWLVYELHYRGLAGVHDDWEWHPGLLRARRSWEQHFLAGLRRHVPIGAGHTVADAPGAHGDGRAIVTRVLDELAGLDGGPSLSKYLMRNATSSQFAEFLTHRSMYHLKEADPHTWAIPRLSGAVKAAMVTIQADEYGGGVTAAMHAQLFRSLLQDWDLHDAYGHYLDHVPGVTLMTTNLISLFGLHRRWRGALVGHLALFEMTSSIPNGRYARGHRRLGGGEDAALFFDEHVVADSVHDQIALHDLAGGLAETEPQLMDDIVFGARCAAYADQAFADHVFDHWGVGASSLRRALGAEAIA